MAIPPQFLKNIKGKRPNDDATEPKSQDNPKEDAKEQPAKKNAKKPHNKKHSNAKRDALMAQLRGGK